MFPDLRGDLITESLIVYSIENLKDPSASGIHAARLSIDVKYYEDTPREEWIVVAIFRMLFGGVSDFPEYRNLLIEADGILLEAPLLLAYNDSEENGFAIREYGFQTNPPTQILALADANVVRFQLEGSPQFGPHGLSPDAVSAIRSFYQEMGLVRQ